MAQASGVLHQGGFPGSGGRGSRAPGKRTLSLVVEALPPPQVGLPAMRSGQRVQTYVPNNDADSLGGDLRRIEDIRAAKWIEPKLFDADIPLLFIWSYQDDELASVSAPRVCAIADRVYQFGRGVDMAWASAVLLDDAELAARLRAYPGSVLRPTPGGRGRFLPCLSRGSLRSLDARHAANSQRFRNEGRQLFSQPPKRASFRWPTRPAVPSRYELRSTDAGGSFAPWKVSRASVLVTWLRDGAGPPARCVSRTSGSRARAGRAPERRRALRACVSVCASYLSLDRSRLRGLWHSSRPRRSARGLSYCC